jgi:membrane-associated phospholipid phosphatase
VAGRRRLVWTVGVALWLALLVLAFGVDHWVYHHFSGPVAEQIGFKTWRFDRPAGGRALLLEELLRLLKRMGHFFFVVFIGVTILALAPARWRQVVVLVLCTATAAAIGQGVIKFSVAKIRPDGPIDSERAKAVLAEEGAGALVLRNGRHHNTGRVEFQGAFSGYRSSSGLTFPSGHTALAFATATALAAFLPRGRWWYFLLATGVGASRIAVGEHFLSDVVAGAGVGYVCARALLAIPRIRAFARATPAPAC